MSRRIYTYRDLPLTAARIQKHLDFASAYLAQAILDRANGADASAEWSMGKRRQHQLALVELRAARL